MQIELPYPPSVNHYWRHAGGRTLLSRKGRRYRSDVVAILTASGTRPLAGPVGLHVVLHPPDRRRRDLDNPLKALLDGLQHGGAVSDDAQFVILHAEWGERVAGGKADVELWQVRA